MSKIVILINGKRFAGKDTAADMITGAQRLALADAVRNEYIDEYGGTITFDDLTDRIRKEQHRPGIITLSEGRKQTHGNTYWVKKLYEDNIRDAKDDSVFVISDWRFIDEYKFLSHCVLDIVSIRIDASVNTRKKRGWTYDASIDESIGESGLDHFEFDHVIGNNGTIEELKCQIREMIHFN